jgi:hypothetical protein
MSAEHAAMKFYEYVVTKRVYRSQVILVPKIAYGKFQQSRIRRGDVNNMERWGTFKFVFTWRGPSAPQQRSQGPLQNTMQLR